MYCKQEKSFKLKIIAFILHELNRALCVLGMASFIICELKNVPITIAYMNPIVN